MQVRKAVIPVAGYGTRLLPATKSQPKEMLPVGRKPCVQYIVEELIQNGADRLLFVTGQDKTAIEDHFDRNPLLEAHLARSGRDELLREVNLRSPARFHYTRQSAPVGLGDAVLQAEDFVGDDPFFVALGDSIISGSHTPGLLDRMMQVYKERKPDAVVAVRLVEPDQVHRYGIVVPEGGILREVPFEVAELIEKPEPSEAPSRFAIAGRYLFSPAIFDALHRTVPEKGGEVQLTDAMRILVRQGGRILAVPLEGDETRYDIGNFGDYFRAFLRFAARDPQFGQQVRQEMMRVLEQQSQTGRRRG